MQTSRDHHQRYDVSFVSTGALPQLDRVEALVNEAYERYRPNTDGEVSQVYPALARVPRDLFGIGETEVLETMPSSPEPIVRGEDEVDGRVSNRVRADSKTGLLGLEPEREKIVFAEPSGLPVEI